MTYLNELEIFQYCKLFMLFKLEWLFCVGNQISDDNVCLNYLPNDSNQFSAEK